MRLIHVLLAAAVAACSGTPATPAVSRAALTPEKQTEHDKLVRTGDEAWRQRQDPASLRRAIDSWQRAVELSGADWRTRAKLARALNLLGEANTEKLTAKTRAEVFRRGANVAQHGLMVQSPAFERLRRGGAAVKDAIKVIEADGAPLAYWYAANLGSYAGQVGVSAGIEHKDTILAVMTHVLEVAPTYEYRGADRALAAYFAAVPPFLGGDLERSRRHFETARRAAPNFLGTYVLMARYYAVGKKDAALFDQLLRQVIDAKPCAPGAPSPCLQAGTEAEATLEKRRAVELMKQRARLF